MTIKQLRFDVEDKVQYLFGDQDAECYVVIATKDKPRMRRGGPDDGKPLYVDIVKLPLSPNRVNPYIHVVDGELDPV